MFRTMLVEDGFTLREIMKYTLEHQFSSMEIMEASDGIEALQKIASQLPHLIFMDISLPGENGLKLTEKIKKDHPEILVIILTGYDLPEYREAATRSKADYFLSKSATTMDQLSGLVKSILSRKGFNPDGSESLFALGG
jgi:DNA-binding NarL/FixJ family response regulator